MKEKKFTVIITVLIVAILIVGGMIFLSGKDLNPFKDNKSATDKNKIELDEGEIFTYDPSKMQKNEDGTIHFNLNGDDTKNEVNKDSVYLEVGE